MVGLMSFFELAEQRNVSTFVARQEGAIER